MNIITKESGLSGVDFREGAVILVDKPLKWTSFDVVNKIRHKLRYKYGLKKFKVGHNGTLDPLATGLLMIFTGKYTKRIPDHEGHNKRYIGTVKLGATTETLDREKEESDIRNVDHIDTQKVGQASEHFSGEMQQEIPFYSAKKINGQAMYSLARKGKLIKPRYKSVEYHKVELLSFDNPYAQFDILCGKGTYIRAFARDLGRQLDTSAYLYDLRRTEVGNYKVTDAVDLDTFCDKLNPL